MPELEIIVGKCDLCQHEGPLVDDLIGWSCQDKVNCFSRDKAWKAGLKQGIEQEFNACCKVLCSYCKEGLPFWLELIPSKSFCHKTKSGKLLPCAAETLHLQKGIFNGC